MKIRASLYITVSIATIVLIIVAVKLTGEKYYENKDYTWYSALGEKDGDYLIRALTK